VLGVEGVLGVDGVLGVEGAVLPPPPPPDDFFLAFFFCLAGAGSDPDGSYEASCGVADDALNACTADGAAAFVVLLLDVALPMPNAARNATTTTAAPMAMLRPFIGPCTC
jgi:hypothetical protein